MATVAASSGPSSNAKTFGITVNERDMPFDELVRTDGLSWRESRSVLVGDCVPVPVLNVNQMFKLIEKRREEIETEDESVYIIFSNISPEKLLSFDKRRENLRLHLRIIYVEAFELLIVKIPTPQHENAHLVVGAMLTEKRVLMEMRLAELMPCGAATKTLLGSNGRVAKEADSSFVNKLVRPNSTDWPTLVIEVADSQSLPRLKLDAKIWIECSDGKVNVVLCIKVNKRGRNIQLLKFTPEISPPSYPNTRSRSIVRPQQVADILVDLSTTPPQTQGAPLTLEFKEVFERQPVPPNEKDIVFSSQDLQEMASAVFS